MSGGTRVLAIAAITLSLVGFPMPGQIVSLASESSDDEHSDAREYAIAHGVTMDDAIERLALQLEVGELGYLLETSEPATYGGLWIEHLPTWRVVVSFTDDGRERIRALVADTNLEGLIDVRRHDWSLQELIADQLRLQERP